MASETVLVIGGGLAGMSAAVALAECGQRVTLVEMRPHLGGRASSYVLPDGSHVDNCQHVTMGCCTNLADFYARTGAVGKIRNYSRMIFAGPAGERYSIQPSALPPPFHLSPSFVCFGALAFVDKCSIARALFRIARCGGRVPGAQDISMLDWLRCERQTQAAIDHFWSIVLVSALDEELGGIAASYGIDVFWKAFLANRSGFLVGIPIVPLSDLYDGCRAAIEQRGGMVRTRATVRELRLESGLFAAAILADGSELRADSCVLAVPHGALMNIFPSELIVSSPALSNLRNLRTSPIIGVHLWYDRHVMDEAFLTLLQGTVQWVFNKTLLSGAPGNIMHSPLAQSPTKGQYLQLVISASYSLVPRSRQEILELCCGELAGPLPATRKAVLVKGTVVKEVSATFSPAPGVDALRTGPESPLANAWLAGDWTRTGWPSTMEGAVRSGYIAAEALLSSRGVSAHFLQPDLPAEGFSRLWGHSPDGQAATPRE
jgi:squalene-associated FAD-dependent desaturase